jgi:mannose-6-phosphate isomerase-like protein (cupin superfamily)
MLADAATGDVAPSEDVRYAGPFDATKKPAVRFLEAPARLADGLCETLLLAVASGSVTAFGQTFAVGDVLVATHAVAGELGGKGLVVEAREPSLSCVVRSRPAPEQTVVRASSARRLAWASGKMSAHLDVPASLSPRLYLGRLEGTAGVAEHTHPGSWEILAAVEAAGTFTLDGRSMRLGPKQIVFVPPGTKHSWSPDAGSKLVAVQMYSPPGPERRFVDLAAAESADAATP